MFFLCKWMLVSCSMLIVQGEMGLRTRAGSITFQDVVDWFCVLVLVNVGKYTIHGAYKLANLNEKMRHQLLQEDFCLDRGPKVVLPLFFLGKGPPKLLAQVPLIQFRLLWYDYMINEDRNSYGLLLDYPSFCWTAEFIQVMCFFGQIGLSICTGVYTSICSLR